MGLLPPIILGALLTVAFALSAQQRLAIASHAGPMPARQIAYLMRAHHQGAIALKQADPALDTITDAPPSTLINDDRILSCITGKLVVTSMMAITGTPPTPSTVTGTAEANAVVIELSRQSVVAPELGRSGQTAWSVGYGAGATLITPVAGVGLSDGSAIHTALGPIALPSACPVPAGAPSLVTQVLP